MDTVAILRGTRDVLKSRGTTGTAYEARDGSCCFIGALGIAQYGFSVQTNAVVAGEPYKYVIAACKSLLPDWDHGLVTHEIYQDSRDVRLPEAVLRRAEHEGAGDEIAQIVLTRAIKLAAEAKIIADAKIADEAEMHAQANRVIEVSQAEYTRV